MRYETPDEFFKRSPGKTIADYYQLRKKIQSGPSKNKPIINKAEEASKADFGWFCRIYFENISFGQTNNYVQASLFP